MTRLTLEKRTALWQDIAAKMPWPELKNKYNLASWQVFYYKNPEKEILRSKKYLAKPEYIARVRGEALEQVLDCFAKNPFVKKYHDEILEEGLRLKAKGKLYYNHCIIAAATYGFLRKNDIPHTIDEVADSFNMKPRILKRVYKKFYSSEKLPQITIPAFIKRYTLEDKIPEDISAKALEHNEQYADVFIGRAPHHVARYWLCRARRELSGDGVIAKVSFTKNWGDVCQATINLMDRQLEERLKA